MKTKIKNMNFVDNNCFEIKYREQVILIFIFLLFSFSLNAQPSNERNIKSVINIGNSHNWRVWIDESATWEDDTLYLPEEFQLSNIPTNPPTCGWKDLYQKGRKAKLPVCVEELFSDGKSDWTYHGVSWFTTSFDVPKDWKDKVIRLEIGKKNCRIEIYLNEKIVGYDIVSGTPYSCNLTEYIKSGTTNRFAFRITNPGGQRGWNDFPLIQWGKYKLPPQRDFGGIGGDVKLLINDKLFIEDLFIKNLLPAKENNIEIDLCINNTTDSSQSSQMFISIKPRENGKSVFEKEYQITIEPSGLSNIKKQIQVKDAKLWDVDNPNMYTIQVSVKSDQYSDKKNQDFGFRVFEVKSNKENEENFYLNGKRFRHSSAIDWGYYAHYGYYPDSTMAKKSIENAKAIGHNGINCHRNMGDPLLLDFADDLGLVILEEPGGFTELIKLYLEKQGGIEFTFEGQLMKARCLRMAKRDRNHPSVIGYILANERDIFDLLRKNIMVDMNSIDDSKLIANQSGGVPGGPSGQVPHIRPYDKKFRLDYMDDHTVFSESKFMEYDLNSHKLANDTAKYGVFGRIDPQKHDNIIYWGEVRCYAGPDNWHALTQQAKNLPLGRTGYDGEYFKPLADKIETYFYQNNLSQSGSKNIQSPSDVSIQAGRGLMYINGRLDQVIMSNNSMDGFAINGWSGGATKLPDEHGKLMEWYSAIVDEGRNLKGLAEDYSYWNRPLQVAIFRKNGKYFKPGQKMNFEVSLINEGILPEGEYEFILKVKDGSGSYIDYSKREQIHVYGCDTYAQNILKEVSIEISPKWEAGYLTIEGNILKNNQVIAYGTEQVLLKNRASFKNYLDNINIEVYQWPAAKEALLETSRVNNESKYSVILAGNILKENTMKTILEKTHNGSTLIIKFNEEWAEKLYDLGLLKQKVTTWGGKQEPYWNGNGWGYLDYFVGKQAIPSGSTIGTNSWEVPDDPKGFYPFVSKHKQKAYGAWFARPDSLLVLIGEISYGKGKIILAPSYPVDMDNAFSDLLFFNMIKSVIR